MLSFLFSRSQVGLLLLRHFSGVYVEHEAKKGDVLYGKWKRYKETGLKI